MVPRESKDSQPAISKNLWQGGKILAKGVYKFREKVAHVFNSSANIPKFMQNAVGMDEAIPELIDIYQNLFY